MLKMEKLTIRYNYRGNGVAFEIKWRDLLLLKSLFPDAQPAESIFVEYGMQSGFEKYRSQLENYIFPALVGFLNVDDLKKIKTVEFVKMPEGTVTYKIEQTYEQFNKEPVFG